MRLTLERRAITDRQMTTMSGREHGRDQDPEFRVGLLCRVVNASSVMNNATVKPMPAEVATPSSWRSVASLG